MALGLLWRKLESVLGDQTCTKEANAAVLKKKKQTGLK